jgi:hypothetical protein
MESNSKKMAAAITGWQQSGMSVTAYCRTSKIQKSVFYYWRKKLAAGNAPAKFALLDTPRLQAGLIEYVHPNGHKLIFHQQVELSFLKALLS